MKVTAKVDDNTYLVEMTRAEIAQSAGYQDAGTLESKEGRIAVSKVYDMKLLYEMIVWWRAFKSTANASAENLEMAARTVRSFTAMLDASELKQIPAEVVAEEAIAFQSSRTIIRDTEEAAAQAPELVARDTIGL
jgi:hypothetical protein